MRTALVIFFLNIQSSYSDNTEAAATEETFDTVQFYASNKGAWRIKTYATDQDIHVWCLGNSPADTVGLDIVTLARTNTEKHYADVLTEGYIIETEDGLRGLRRELKKRGLSESLKKSRSGFVFWTPEGTNYETKSAPKQ